MAKPPKPPMGKKPKFVVGKKAAGKKPGKPAFGKVVVKGKKSR